MNKRTSIEDTKACYMRLVEAAYSTGDLEPLVLYAALINLLTATTIRIGIPMEMAFHDLLLCRGIHEDDEPSRTLQ